MTPPLSRSRPSLFSALAAEEWDLLVIGGGVTGAGIAHDAATRGLRVALVEAGDIGGGTSSRSSRLVHGGLRYLETFDFHLVWESSAERARLLRMAPHLVRPLPFLFPVYRGGPVGTLKLRAGMWLYDGLAAFRNIHRHRMLSAAEVVAKEPALDRSGLLGAALYYDASVDDARLALAAARAAHAAGAAIATRAEVTAIESTEDRVTGVRIRDALTHAAETVVRARVVLNATGPWSDQVRRLADPRANPRLRPTKGVHLMVPRERIGNRHAITLRSPVDQRVMFVLPWGDFTYIGTTDTDFRGDPRDVQASAEDVDYLLASANRMYPDAKLTPADVLSTWAGVRPLLAPTGERGESATSREHEIWWDESGLLSIAGGKLTTYRIMAREAVDEVIAGGTFQRTFGPSGTDAPFPGTPAVPLQEFQEGFRVRAAEAGLDAAAADHLSGRFGTDADDLLGLIAAEPGLAAPVAEGQPYLWAEVVHAVRSELALTLEDVLARRTHLLYETADGALSAAAAVSARMAQELGWSDAFAADQLAAYRASVAATRPIS